MNKKLSPIAFLLFGIFIVTIISRKIYTRIDLTQDKRYTLSSTTKNSIAAIDKQLVINVYLEGDFPAEFQRLQIETRQFLEELRALNPAIYFRFINPDSHRKALVKKGMMPSQLTVEENGKLSNAIIFPWAEITYGHQTETVSLLPNSVAKTQEAQLQNAIEGLEYSFTSAIHTVVKNTKKTIAVLSGNGELEDLNLYSFLSEVGKKYRLAKFTLDSVAVAPEKTLNQLTKYDMAIIAKPTQKFTSEEKFTLDQFIVHGGKTLWMLDNVQADQDSLLVDGKMLAYPRDLNLTDLLFNYGVRVNGTLIKDLYAAKIPLATGTMGNRPQFQHLNWFFHPLVHGNPNHVITKNTAPIRLQFANPIDTLQNGVKKTPLLLSSMFTQTVGTPKIIELASIAKTPQQNAYKGGHQLFAVLLEGAFTSAYKSRVHPFTTPLFMAKGMPNKMIVIADGDVGKNQILKGKPTDLSIDKWTGEQFGNKDFLLNAVDYLLDDNGIIDLRNKAIQINHLNKQHAYNERTFWQFFNIGLPLLVLFVFGFGFNYWRKKKYS
ncbi:gliding motility-associated ABC transporter substrate-binding protein GldG [Tenacibaculum maritimum]|uniref:gliding motility-associated ABC transporter substrate-binding protein GldG n=1 Tax=Tenacibaculum maritimum TaxID=107401 RepID=UPI003876BEBE